MVESKIKIAKVMIDHVTPVLMFVNDAFKKRVLY